MSSPARPQSLPREIDRAAAVFAARFGRPPTVAAHAPGRVNLIGEHTDYNEGFVLPMAIDRYTIIAADRSTRDYSECFASDLNESARFDLAKPLAPLPRGAAANYLLGVADQFQKRGQQLRNLDLIVTSTIPIGAGLASSAAVEVAFVTLLAEMFDVKLDPLAKALLCQQAEHAFARTPCGIMDMYVASMARVNHAMLIDCRSLEAPFVPLPSCEETSILIIDTGVKHDLAAGAYAERRATCETAAKKLGVPSLREATLEMLEQGDLTPIERRRVLHVVAENARTILAAEALARGDLESFGRQMFASHDSLRDLYEVSCDELDVLVNAARQMKGRGVFGARLTGGGFGGCAVAVGATPELENVKNHLQNAFSQRFGRPCAMFTSNAAGSARSCRL